MRFKFLSEKTKLFFRIDAITGDMATAIVIDRDLPTLCRQKEACELAADVMVTQPIRYFQIIRIVIEIIDLNDNKPIFLETLTTLEINEATIVNSSYLLPTATDFDNPAYGIKNYFLINSPEEFLLSVSPKFDFSLDLRLVLNKKLDRENISGYRLLLIAVDGGSPSQTGSLFIDVIVTDSNDNHPKFNSTRYEISIQENAQINSVVIRLEAFDPDENNNGFVRYKFSPRTVLLHGKIFDIRQITGEIIVCGSVDRERTSQHQLVVIAYDEGVNVMSSETTVVVKVEDMNDNAPQITFNTLNGLNKSNNLFNQLQTEIPEDSPVGLFVAQVNVVDVDAGDNGLVNCSVLDKTFALIRKYPTEFQLEVAQPLDRERTDVYNVNIRCHDMAEVSRFNEKSLKIIITDVNDNWPVFLQQIYKISLLENNPIGFTLHQVSATDKDLGDNGLVRYSLSGVHSAKFHVDRQGVVTIHFTADRETQDIYEITVLAIDGGSNPLTGTTAMMIVVEDVNDERPKFLQKEYHFAITENQLGGSQVGVTVATIVATDADVAENSKLMYKILEDRTIMNRLYFKLDKHTGELKVAKSLAEFEEQLFLIAILVSDSGVPPRVSSSVIDVYV
ncbi:hypothetical protein HELRODRAFT_65571, partial [Helobdella robusta]|uniref:Cadherin domain-containing protein n=1 Tax=Helobdella robusta TaxID=6412 RepID=T1FYA0_HELRO